MYDINFGKLINGNLEYLKLPLKIGSEDIFTNDSTLLLQNGYKPIERNTPEYKEGYIAVPEYSETDSAIIQNYKYITESEVEG